jgi:hypothetical protein
VKPLSVRASTAAPASKSSTTADARTRRGGASGPDATGTHRAPQRVPRVCNPRGAGAARRHSEAHPGTVDATRRPFAPHGRPSKSSGPRTRPIHSSSSLADTSSVVPRFDHLLPLPAVGALSRPIGTTRHLNFATVARLFLSFPFLRVDNSWVSPLAAASGSSLDNPRPRRLNNRVRADRHALSVWERRGGKAKRHEIAS